MLSLLQVIDNPNQDIPLLAVLMRPPVRLLRRRRRQAAGPGQKEPVYASLVRGAQEDPRCAQVLKDLEQYRGLAAGPAGGQLPHPAVRQDGYTNMVLAMEEGRSGLLTCGCCSATPGTTRNTGAGGDLRVSAVSGQAAAEQL